MQPCHNCAILPMGSLKGNSREQIRLKCEDIAHLSSGLKGFQCALVSGFISGLSYEKTRCILNTHSAHLTLKRQLQSASLRLRIKTSEVSLQSN